MDTVSNGGLLQPFGPVGVARPFRQHLEGNLVPGQTNACLYPFCVGGYGAWYDIAFACALTAKDRDLHCVPFLSDAGRTHRVAQHFQPLAQVLQAAERQIRDHDITDRDMSPNPLWAPVIDWSDLEIMLVGAAAGFEFPELVKSGNNILSIQIVCTTDQDGMKAAPLGCVLDPGLVNRDIAIVGERLETTIPTTAEAGRLEAALELFFCDFRSTVKCNTCKSWE